MTAAPTESLLTELRSLPRAYWVLVGGWFVNRFGTFVYPFLTILLTERGHSPTAVASVLSAHGVGQLMASLLGGYFSDRFGRRSTLVLGTLAHACAVFVLYFAVYSWQALGAIVALMWAVGFAGGFYQPASSALLADIVPEPLRLRAYSMLRLANNAGFACGTSAGGFILKYSPFWLFAGDAITTGSFCLIALFLLPSGLKASAAEATWSEAWKNLRVDRPFWALFFATILSSCVFIQFSSTFALEMGARGLTLQIGPWLLSPQEIFGCVLGWNGIMVAVFELPMTRWMQRFPAQRVIRIGYLLLGGGFAMNALPGGVPVIFLAMTVFTIGEMLSQPVRSAYVAQLAPRLMRGRYMGMLALGGTLASVFGPQIFIPLHKHNATALWIACGLLGVLAAWVLGRGEKGA